MLTAERARADEPAPAAGLLAGLHLTPAQQWRPVGSQFYGRRAAMWACLLHVLPVAVILFLLRGHELPPPPVEPSLELVIDKSAYVGAGPQVVTPAQPPQPQLAPQPAPQPAPPPVPQAAPLPALPVPPPLPPLPPKPDAMPLPPPLPPRPLAATRPVQPPVQPPVQAPVQAPVQRSVQRPVQQPIPRPTAPPALHPAAPPPPHLGDNQPVGHGQAFGRMILASPDETFNKKPPYPEEALAQGEQGRVLLSIHVGANGRALGVQIISSSGYAVLDDAARDAVLGWVYKPAQLHGLPVDSVILFPIRFQLDQ